MERTNPEEFTVTASDGQSIAASWYRGSRTGAPACIIGPALGVPRRFYDGFARFLAGQGFDVLSFDFRGFGDSANERLRFEKDFESFAFDLDAAIAEARRRAGRIVYVGHSLGSHALGWSSGSANIERAISIASGTGYYGWSPFPENVLRYVFWTVFLPAATHVAGYYPGRTLGVLGDIPKPIALAWAEMCKRPGFFKPDLADPAPESFHAYRAPFLVISFSDDRIMPKAATDELGRNFPNAVIERLHLTPAEIGLDRVGHFNALKTGHEKLWPALAAWLAGETWRL